jgi:hypothetical protein
MQGLVRLRVHFAFLQGLETRLGNDRISVATEAEYFDRWIDSAYCLRGFPCAGAHKVKVLHMAGPGFGLSQSNVLLSAGQTGTWRNIRDDISSPCPRHPRATAICVRQRTYGQS